MRALRWLPLLLGCQALLGAPAAAEPAPIEPGESLQALELSDQHGQRWRVDDTTRLLLMVRDRGASYIVIDALSEDGEALLAQAGALYVTDIHRAPKLVRRVFVKRQMRKLPYSILLDEEGSHTRRIPTRKGLVTLLRLDGLRVAAVEYIESSTVLREILQP